MLLNFCVDSSFDLGSINPSDTGKPTYDCIVLSEELLRESQIVWSIPELLNRDKVADNLINHLLILTSELVESFMFSHLSFRRWSDLIEASEVIFPVS